ncbi:MAG: NTP transferase domain-containing protein [Mycobacteriales bacterium]|nr:NTP transferase domain-containing protein [Mycobacteriales bacterium]
MTPAYDAVVLCGGSARRLGGVDKPGLVVGGRPMLDTVLLAVASATVRVCVGAVRPVAGPVVWCQEDPPGSGPVAGLTAALPLVAAELVVLLAADLPLLTPAAVDALVDSGPGTVVVDDDGREQWLFGCWTTSSLRAAVGAGSSRLGEVLRPLVTLRLALPDRPWFDVDSEADRRAVGPV